MKKKIVIGFGILALAVIGVVFYMDVTNKNKSPKSTTELTVGDLKISVRYSRPSVRSRVIFGADVQKSLQPYGKYWRLGANEATEITFSKNVTFNGEILKGGSYRIYAVPGGEYFDIGLNSELGKWGYDEPDYSKDILKTKVKVQKLSSPIEQFTISMKETNGEINIYLEWADVQLVIPVIAQ